MGRLIPARTGFPFFVPGKNLGHSFNTRMASKLKSSPGERIICRSVKLPSSLTIKLVYTLPCILFFFAFGGYTRFLEIYWLKAVHPPGKLGQLSGITAMFAALEFFSSTPV